MGLDSMVSRHTISTCNSDTRFIAWCYSVGMCYLGLDEWTPICGLTVSQQTPGFWGVTALYQSLGIQLPKA